MVPREQFLVVHAPLGEVEWPGTLEEAPEKAIAAAKEEDAGWRSTDHRSDSFVDTVCEGAGADPWGEGALPVPFRFSECGTLSGAR